MLTSVINQITVLAQMPGQNIQPQAPSEIASKTDRFLNFFMFVGIAGIIVGVITAGVAMVLSRREGSSEEATALALRVGVGALIVGSASSIVVAFL